MEPTQPPVQAPMQPPEPPAQTGSKKMSGRTKLALWLMIGPTALLIVGLLLTIGINWATATVTEPAGSSDQLFGETNPGRTIADIITLVIGAVVAATWLPGLIAGIVLLATNKK